MFKQKSNVAFNNVLFRNSRMLCMHASMERLYTAAKEIKKTEGQSAVARLLSESPQTLKNWESRGISKGGAINAQELFGCSANWLETGREPKYIIAPADGSGAFLRAASDYMANQVNRHVDSAQAAANVVANTLPAKLSSPQFSELAITVANLVDQVPKSDDTTRTQMLAAVLQVWQVWIAKQQQQSPSASDQKKPSEQLQPLSEPRQQYLHRYVP